MPVKSMRAPAVIPAAFHFDAPARRGIATTTDASELELHTAVRHDIKRRHASVAPPVAVRATGVPTMMAAKTYRDNTLATPAFAVMKYTEIENAPIRVDATVASEQRSVGNQLPQNWFIQTIQYVDSDGTFANIRIWHVILLVPSAGNSQDEVIGKSI